MPRWFRQEVSLGVRSLDFHQPGHVMEQSTCFFRLIPWNPFGTATLGHQEGHQEGPSMEQGLPRQQKWMSGRNGEAAEAPPHSR